MIRALMSKTRRWWLVALFAAASCSSHPPAPVAPPPPPVEHESPIVTPAPAPMSPGAAELDRDLPGLAQRSVKLFEEVAGVFTQTGEDCPAATTRLGELRVTYADVVRASEAVLHEGRAKELKVALKPYDDRLDVAAKSIMSSKTLPKCSVDPAFARAFDQLVGSPP